MSERTSAPPSRLWAAWLSLAWLAACSGAPDGGRGGEVGVFEPPAAPDAASGGGLVPVSPSDSDADELRARIEDIAGLELDVLTVGCAGECADVVAAARGGNPPYAVQWDDGSTAELRRVCPQRTGALTLEVTDTSLPDPEFGYVAQTARASLTSEVLQCPPPDAGPMQADAGPSPGSPAMCEQTTRTASAAAGCQPLRYTECPSPIRGSRETRTYELPFPLVPGGPRCLIAFGNVEGAAGPSLDILVAGTNVGCEGGTLSDPMSNEIPPNEGELGRIICLDEPWTTLTKLMVEVYPGYGGFADLELRMCEQCPPP